MPDWNASHYLKYGDQRTRAAADLVARIRLDQPHTIVDLGCGPGNSTQLLQQRWPHAEVAGIDNSAAMIDTVKQSYPDQTWVMADIHDWTAEVPFDLVYSNAALQWLPNHAGLIPQLFSCVAPGGALAFQIPSSTFATVRTLIHEVSREIAWTQKMDAPRNALTMHAPEFYYDLLASSVEGLDIWETEYHHVMESTRAVVDWMSSTGLQPFLAVLDTDDDRQRFLDQLQGKVDVAYEVRSDGRVLFPFRRTFVIAYR